MGINIKTREQKEFEEWAAGTWGNCGGLLFIICMDSQHKKD